MSIDKKSERKRTWKGGKKMLPFYIISTVVLFIFGAVFIGGYVEYVHIKSNIDTSKTVEATITDVHLKGHDGLYHYELFYEYTSINGIYYCGTTGYYNDRETAAKHIGEKISIYIDKDGHSAPSLGFLKPAYSITALAGGIIFLVAGLAVLTILIIPHKWN